MIGGIIGDIIGSTYESKPKKFDDITQIDIFKRDSYFTDDTVLNIAVAAAIISLIENNKITDSSERKKTFRDFIFVYAKRYPNAGYGQMFSEWIKNGNGRPYHSYGNGSAMRVPPIGFLNEKIDTIQKIARDSSIITHNHRLGLWGAEVIATAVYLANQNESKEKIMSYLKNKYNCVCSESLKKIRTWYSFDSSAKGSVPVALSSFLESEDFETAIRNAISVGGDSDTLACIAGAIAQAFYKRIPAKMKTFAEVRIGFEMKQVIKEFGDLCNIKCEYFEIG